MNKQQGWGRTPARGAAWRQWVGGLLASAVLAGCGGGSSTGAVGATATAADDTAGTRPRALAVTTTPLIADGYLVLRNVADPTRLLAGPQHGMYGIDEDRFSGAPDRAPFTVSAAPGDATPPSATLHFTAVSAEEATTLKIADPANCGFLKLRVEGASYQVSSLHIARWGSSAGKPMWVSPRYDAQGVSPSEFVCLEPSPGGQGLYLRWRDEPGKVLSLTADGQVILVPEPTTSEGVARASFVPQPLQAYAGNQLPLVDFRWRVCDFYPCMPPRFIEWKKLPAGTLQAFSVGALDPDGEVDRVELLDDGQVVATARSAPYLLRWTPTTLGRRALSVRVWDRQGAWVDDRKIPIEVVAPSGSVPLTPPVIVSPRAGATLTAGWHTVELQSDASLYTSVYLDDQVAFGSQGSGRTVGQVWLAPGTHVLIPKTGDHPGQPVEITVLPDAQAPAVTISTSAVGFGASVGSVTRLSASIQGGAAPYQVRYRMYRFYAVYDRPIEEQEGRTQDAAGVKIDLGNGDPAHPQHALEVRLPGGDWSLIAEVTDAAGKVSRSTPRHLGVGDGPRLTLTSSALTSKVVPLNQGNWVYVGWFGTDPLAIQTVELFDGEVSIGRIAVRGNAYTNAIKWTPSVAGTHALSARLLPQPGTGDAPVIGPVARVYVKGADNLPPVVRISSPAAGTGRLAGAPIVVRANPGDYDGYVRRVEFYDGDVLIGTATASPWSVNWTGGVGAHRLVAKAFDNSGASTLSSPIDLTLKASNVAPTVSVVTPAAGSSVAYGKPVTIAANPGDLDGFVRRVEFFQDGVLIDTATSRPWTARWTPTTPGNRKITARVTDNSDVSVTSRAVTVTVLAP